MVVVHTTHTEYYRMTNCGLPQHVAINLFHAKLLLKFII